MNPIVLVSYLASSSIISHIQTMTGNHGCNGTFSYGEDGDEEDEVQITEMNADPNFAPLGLLNKAPKHSPVVERHLRQVLSIGDITLKDIKRGEEILCDYLAFIGNPADWKDEVLR